VPELVQGTRDAERTEIGAVAPIRPPLLDRHELVHGTSALRALDERLEAISSRPAIFIGHDERDGNARDVWRPGGVSRAGSQGCPQET
jgi:hypothetical protein